MRHGMAKALLEIYSEILCSAGILISILCLLEDLLEALDRAPWVKLAIGYQEGTRGYAGQRMRRIKPLATHDSTSRGFGRTHGDI